MPENWFARILGKKGAPSSVETPIEVKSSYTPSLKPDHHDYWVSIFSRKIKPDLMRLIRGEPKP